MKTRFFLWTKIFIKIKTRDKTKCSQKILWEGGGNFYGGKLTPENASQEICPPSPKEKKKEKRDIIPSDGES